MTDVLAASSFDFQGPLSDLLVTLLLFIPKVLLFLLILLVGWLIAIALRSVTNRVLEAVRFDSLAERGALRSVLSRSRYDASDIIAMLVFYAVLLFTLQLAFGIWGPNPVSDLITAIIAWLPQAFVAILIIVVAAAVANAVKDMISGVLGVTGYGRALALAASWFILGLGIIAALNQVGIAVVVTNIVLIAILATIGGILVVGVGGGLVRPMQSRWDRILGTAEVNAADAKAKIQAALSADTSVAPTAPEAALLPQDDATRRLPPKDL